MDNSLFLYKQRVEKMIEVMQRFADALNHHVIIQPHSTLEDAVRCGFPEDIALTYIKRYYVKNESSAEDMIHYINNDIIPYLTHVALHINNAMNAGESGYNGNASRGATGSADKTSPIPPVSPVHSRLKQSSMSREELALRTTELIKRDATIQKNNKELEGAIGIKKGPAMSIEEADKQNANPNYKECHEFLKDKDGEYVRIWNDDKSRYEFLHIDKWVKQGNNFNILNDENRYRKNPDWQYSINCATCAAAYALRLRGFDVTAKGNPEEDGNRNTWLSYQNSFEIWNDLDGTKAIPTYYYEWMQQNGVKSMTPNDYKNFFEEECKEQGVYIVTVAWKGGDGENGGHATILQRDKDGKLYYIEPQVYDERKSTDGRLDLDYLIRGMAEVQPKGKGIMRVDNKLFNTDYVDLFNV